MADEDAWVKETQETLGKLITKPKMTEKYLKKPPFRFLHDIVMEVTKSTKFGQGLFTPEECDAAALADKAQKVEFLNKAISVVAFALGEKLEVSANKVVAGMEAEKTNAFLQKLHLAATTCVGEKSDEAVARVQAGESAGDAKPKKTKKKDEEPAAPAAAADAAPTAAAGGDDAAAAEEEEKKKKEEERRKRSEKKKRDEEKKKKAEEEEAAKATAASAEADGAAAASAAEADEEDKRKKEEEKKKAKEEERKRKKDEEKRAKEEDERRAAEDADAAAAAAAAEQQAAASRAAAEAAEMQARQRQQDDDLGIRQDQDPGPLGGGGGGQFEDEEELRRRAEALLRGEEDDMGGSRMERPRTAGRKPPKVTSKVKTVTDDPGLTANVVAPAIIAEGAKDDDDEDMFEAPAQAGNMIKVDDGEHHGKLVRDLLAEKKQEEEKERLRKEEEATRETVEEEKNKGIRMGKLKRKKNDVAAANAVAEVDVSKLSDMIQQLCQAANPLGKSIDLVHQDIANMGKELDHWKQEHREATDQYQQELKTTDELLQPLYQKLAELDEKISEQKTKIRNSRSRISKNDVKVTSLLDSVVSGSGAQR